MILTVNIGNTYTDIGLAEGKSIVHSAKLPTYHTETSHGYAIKLNQMLDLLGVPSASVSGAVISSVVPALTAVLCGAIKLLLGFDALVVGAGVKTGLHIATDDPGTVASDLVANSVAAKEEYPLPAIVVDMGTATTIMAVDENGRYIGGAILPGAKIALDALSHEASLLTMVDISAPKKAISASTAECMRSGIIYGTAGAVDGVLDRFSEEMKTPSRTVILTGELAPLFMPYIKHKLTHDEHLTLKGLAAIYERNKK